MKLIKNLFHKVANKNKIIFSPINDQQVFDSPTPASRSIPDWYKKTPKTTDLKPSQIDNEYKTNGTVKLCMPFLDALRIGYTYCLPMDVQVEVDNKKEIAQLKWAAGGEDFISTHSLDQFPIEGIHKNDIYQPFKWLFPFSIKTPKGYSTFFTHPLNRNDLPFKTLSGIVETDLYPLNVNFPFLLAPPKNLDFFIIEAGTPIAQIIPFKREEWISECSAEPVSQRATFDLKKKIQNSYKKQWWIKKRYR